MFERNGVLDGRDRAVFSESGTDRCLEGLPMFERNGVLDGRDRTVFSESGTDRCLEGAPHV